MGSKIFATEHFGNTKNSPNNPFEESYGLLERPSDFGVSFLEVSRDKIEQNKIALAKASTAGRLFLEKGEKIIFDRPLFGVFAVHDYDIYKIASWDEVKIMGVKIFRTKEDREKLFKEYEEVVRTIIKNKNVKVVTAEQILAFYGKYKNYNDKKPTGQTTPTSKSGIIQGKCGDGICDEFEKANPGICPLDCK
jgi:hypothetical protein